MINRKERQYLLKTTTRSATWNAENVLRISDPTKTEPLESALGRLHKAVINSDAVQSAEYAKYTNRKAEELKQNNQTQRRC